MKRLLGTYEVATITRVGFNGTEYQTVVREIYEGDSCVWQGRAAIAAHVDAVIAAMRQEALAAGRFVDDLDTF